MTELIIRRFVQDWQNTHKARVRERYGFVAGATGVATNLFLFALKMTMGLLSGSIAIVADAVNNLSDSASSLVTLIAFRMSGKPADAEHPYGHARMEHVSGLVVSLTILFLGLQLGKSSLDKILHPQPATYDAVVVAALVAAILVKVWQAAFYRNIGRRIDSLTLVATAADSRNDVLATSAVLLAALADLLFDIHLDGWMGLAVAGFISWSGIRLIRDTIHPLLGSAPTRETIRRISEKILSYEGIIGLHDLIVHSYGASETYASAHCELPAEQDIMVSHDIIDTIERDFLREEGIHLVIHLDPVVTNDPVALELKAAVRRMIDGISPEIGMHDFRIVQGIRHVNLIFDIIVPYDYAHTDEELKAMIADRVSERESSWYAVITVDHAYGTGDAT